MKLLLDDPFVSEDLFTRVKHWLAYRRTIWGLIDSQVKEVKGLKSALVSLAGVEGNIVVNENRAFSWTWTGDVRRACAEVESLVREGECKFFWVSSDGAAFEETEDCIFKQFTRELKK